MTSSTPTGPGTGAAKIASNALPLPTTNVRKIRFDFVIITFFTILRAAWLLHPSQVEKYPSVHNDYYQT